MELFSRRPPRLTLPCTNTGAPLPLSLASWSRRPGPAQLRPNFLDRRCRRTCWIQTQGTACSGSTHTRQQARVAGVRRLRRPWSGPHERDQWTLHPGVPSALERRPLALHGLAQVAGRGPSGAGTRRSDTNDSDRGRWCGRTSAAVAEGVENCEWPLSRPLRRQEASGRENRRLPLAVRHRASNVQAHRRRPVPDAVVAQPWTRRESAVLKLQPLSPLSPPGRRSMLAF